MLNKSNSTAHSALINNPVLLMLVSIVGIPLIFYPSTSSMIDVWISNETFTHGFFIFPVTVWLIWGEREKLSQLKPQSEPRVLALFFPFLGAWVVSNIVDVQVVQQLSMVSLIILSIWITVGLKIVKHVLFPLLFLYFAVPLGQSLIPPLMDFTANFTVFMIQLSGIPVFREGLFFTLPSGDWSVVEECSGVRYLIASFALGTIYAYIGYTSLRKRLIFIAISILLPIIANGLRAYGIVMIGHFSSMELATGADHLVYGWVFFGVVIFLLFYAGSFWFDPVESAEKSVSPAQPSEDAKSNNTHAYLLATLFIITLTRIYSWHLESNKVESITTASLSLPDNFSGWQFDETRYLKWQPIFINPDVSIKKGYIFGNELVQVNIGYYQNQRQGAEAVSTSNHIASPLGGEWKRLTSTDIQENDMYFTETELRGPGLRTLVWQWYKIGSFKTPNPYIAKALDAYNVIFTGRTDASFITLATPLINSKNISRQRLRDFWLEASDEIDNLIEEAAPHE